VSVCLSVTSRCSTETAKRRITQTTPRDSPGVLVFRCRKYRQNSKGVTPNGGTKCRWGKLNAGAACKLATFDAKLYQLSSVASLSHRLFVCSTFAVMQRVEQICHISCSLLNLPSVPFWCYFCAETAVTCDVCTLPFVSTKPSEACRVMLV